MSSIIKDQRGCCWTSNKLSFLFLLFLLIGLSRATFDNHGQRVVRSPDPGLFSNLPKPGEVLEKLKSPDDLNVIKDQLKSFGGLTKVFEQAIEAGKNATDELKKAFEAAKNRIINLEKALKPDENYWAESKTCGGVIVSQTGTITYKLESMYTSYTRCIWTVQTNYRSQIIAELVSGSSLFKDQGYDTLTVTEVSGDVNNPSLRTVEVDMFRKYIFKGPLLIISFITDGSQTDTGFGLKFEGTGEEVYTDTVFQHFHLENWADSFSAENVTGPNTTTKVKANRIFSTMVINPKYQNVTELTLSVDEGSMNLKPESCEESALTFYDDFRNSNSSFKRCCGTKCEESNFKNNDGVFLSTLARDASSANDFKFSWEIDTQISSEDSVNACGGKLFGRVGRISYKADEEYAINERCTWMIRPTGKSRIKLTLLSEEFENGYDLLTVTTIGNGNDFGLDSEPENTILQAGKVYNFSGPVIFLTFFSDGSTQGKGFELVWEDAGSNVPEGSSIMGLPLYLPEESGTQSLNLYGPIYQVAIINPKYPDGSSLHLTLEKLVVELGSDCGPNGLTIFGSDHGNFSIAKRFCQNAEGGFLKEDFETSDGIFIIVYHAQNTLGDIEFSWKKGSVSKEAILDADPVVVEQTEGCGGVLVGDSGRIDYKLNTTYSEYEQCTWVIQSARRSKITVRLVKDGFESCCDFLVVSPLNADTGTISKNSVKIKRENKLESFTASVIFVTFHSDASIGDHGFSLEFTTSGDLVENEFVYKHHRLSEIEGSITIPTEGGTAPQKNEIMTFVFTPDPISGTQQTNISVNADSFGVDKDGLKDSLEIAEVPQYTESFSKRFTCSNQSSSIGKDESSSSCVSPYEISADFEFLNNRAFVAIFKSVDSSTDKSFKINWTTLAELKE